MEFTSALWAAVLVLCVMLIAKTAWAISLRRADRAARLKSDLALTAAEAGASESRIAAGRQEEVIRARDAEIARQGAELGKLGAKIAEVERENTRLNVRIQELETTRDKEREAAEEKLKLLAGVREDMQDRFKQLADEIMRQHGDELSKTNKEKLEALLTPFREQVKRFEEELRAVNKSADSERTRLSEQIRQLTQRSEAISAEAVNLTRALKGDKQLQGAWGEMILERLLEDSGLEQGLHYEVHAHRRDDDGGRWHPDVVIRMPREKFLVIDSKVSLVSYEAAVSAESEEERGHHLAAHVRAMRAHIDTLSAKGYHTLEQGSVDYVLMFVPIEGALSEAWRQQGDLASYAVSKGVGLMSPTTLMVTLRTVDHIWAVERRNRNADAIADRAGKLYDKVAGFVEEMDRVSLRLAQAQDAHNTAMDRLTRGRGNVLSQVEKLKLLGAKTSKSLGADVLDEDDEIAETGSPAIAAVPEAAE